MNKSIIEKNIERGKFAYQDNITSFERLKSMLLDHAIVCFTILPIFIIPSFIGMGTTLGTGNVWINRFCIILIMGIYLNKDILRGRSAAKRILGQIVIDNKTNEPASEVKCVIRNFTDIFWIVEIPIVMFSPSRRIGDLIANTKIVRTEKDEIKSMWTDLRKANKSNWILSFGIAIIYLVFIFNLEDKIGLGLGF